MDIKAGYFFTMGNITNLVVALFDLLFDSNPSRANLIELLEIRMVLIENTPEL